MLTNLFSQCGLNETEQKVLIYLIPRSWIPAGRIAKALSIKRPTIYATLAALQDLGVVSKNVRNGVQHFASISPKLISSTLETRALIVIPKKNEKESS